MRAIIRIFGVVMLLCLTQLFPAANAQAAEKAQNATDRYCTDCHGANPAVKRFADGSFVSTYVDPAAFRKSVHGALSCTVCHNEFSEAFHPVRSFRGKLQYRIMSSRNCRECHPDNAIVKKKIHVALLKKERAGNAIVCINCHSTHSVSRVGAGQMAISEDEHCLGCHEHEGRKYFVNGENIPTRVDKAEILGSAHSDLGCTDCHFGFSAAEHPRSRYGSVREYRHSSLEMCRRCHYDKYSKVTENIHYAMLSAGRLDAPTCVDCHGVHAVSSPGKSRLVIVDKCAACHKNIYASYARSVHGAALVNENNRDVAICTDCHTSHGMKATSSNDFHDEIPDTCSACHSNASIMGKYGLSTDVVKTYLSDFHGMTLSLYRKETWRHYGPPPAMAVCTDCHGTHNISRMSGSDVQIMKSKLLKRCSSCHPGASEKFPDAWLSHYRPSFMSAPMVFVTERFYGIMLPVTIAGILFLVLLDLWRYYKNR